ncbi:hypothetical protein [Porphyromonas gingivalis]|jgi:hypothetical protein|uniref:hypothetical protein n=1 Tax=Porphyromonas gingivalis TaxID=837 RepID=UPI0011809AB9|nr:hypothetical protein [Porphyromonas gingivalis]MCE8173983.1 hypothetical protein [Porphyromonas gingivalis]MCE8179822.1 hypothetical protein [Porphyromonas gingivalis]MCE8182706.1 hypothetical protein [Porphyromonas gingivalis]
MKAKSIRIAIIAITGLGLFAIQGTKQESAQSANAQALKKQTENRGTVDCYSRYANGDETIYDCGPCSRVREKKGRGNQRRCAYNGGNTDSGHLQDAVDVAP